MSRSVDIRNIRHAALALETCRRSASILREVASSIEGLDPVIAEQIRGAALEVDELRVLLRSRPLEQW